MQRSYNYALRSPRSSLACYCNMLYIYTTNSGNNPLDGKRLLTHLLYVGFIIYVLYRSAGVHGTPRHRSQLHGTRPKATAAAVCTRPQFPQRHGRRRPALQHAARARSHAHGALRHQHVSANSLLTTRPLLLCHSR